MIVYPRSMAGLNLNPNEDETNFQMNNVLTLLKRVCQKTYLSESGWDIIRLLGHPEQPRPSKSICIYGEGKTIFLLLNQSLFSSPVRELRLQPSSFGHGRFHSSNGRDLFPPNDARPSGERRLRYPEQRALCRLPRKRFFSIITYRSF